MRELTKHVVEVVMGFRTCTHHVFAAVRGHYTSVAMSHWRRVCRSRSFIPFTGWGVFAFLQVGRQDAALLVAVPNDIL